MPERQTLLNIQGEIREGLAPYFAIGWNGIDYVLQWADWKKRANILGENEEEHTTPPATITVRGPCGGGRMDTLIIRLGSMGRQVITRKATEKILQSIGETLTIPDEHAFGWSERSFSIGRHASGGIAIDVENPFDTDDYEKRMPMKIQARLLIIPEGEKMPVDSERTTIIAAREELYILSEVYRSIQKDVRRLMRESKPRRHFR